MGKKEGGRRFGHTAPKGTSNKCLPSAVTYANELRPLADKILRKVVDDDCK